MTLKENAPVLPALHAGSVIKGQRSKVSSSLRSSVTGPHCRTLSGVRPQKLYLSVCPSENQVWRSPAVTCLQVGDPAHLRAMLRPLRLLLSGLQTQPSRCCSSFVSRMRYVNRLKEDDEACTAALKDGSIFLFHRLSPLLRCTDVGTFSPATLTCSDVQSVLQRLGSDGSPLKEAVLIGCSEQNQAQFCLDVGELDQAAVEEASQGTFIDLRKAFFLLPAAEAPLVSKGQALLRWHQSTRFCGASGQPTQRNRAGSQRFCSSSSTVYYPKVRPWRRRSAGRWRRRWVWRSRASPTAPRSTGHSRTAPSCWVAMPWLAPPTLSCAWTAQSWKTLAGSPWTKSHAPSR
ncbi:nucleoside diphosphate-linked moiety X motif 13 isoform X3 [Oreochromis aureus]|uniref:nucleoside diphosphate-linked moiety X motif 13 isoform X3 n=1 Tax=Oreochromis aureus TaxID=47969 RepID=UPI001953E191|nr:nucleoside diphosphate-linked moiety X motif 13 isoform X3 [Oreochromis aureus]